MKEQKDFLQLFNGCLPVEEIINSWYGRFKNSNYGAIVTFIGVVRDENKIDGLSFDIYEPILNNWFDTWQKNANEKNAIVLMAHSKGDVLNHESSYIAAVCSPKRRVALELIDEFVEDFKAQAPIWKYDIINNQRIYAKDRSSVVSSDSLERAMLVINETPGAIVSKAEVKPGTQVGTSDFIVETQASKAYGGYVVADNYGSKYVGKNRVMAGVDLNSPFKIGDKLSLSGLISNGADLKNYKVAYNAPLMANGLRGEISYTNTDYNLVKLGDGILDEEYYGDSKTLEAKVIYPIIKSRLETLDFTTTYANKNISSTTNETDTKDINSLSLGLNHIKNQTIFGLEGKTTLEGIFTAGELDDNNDMNGSYQKINLNTALDLNFNPIYSMSTSLKLQKAFGNKNLDGSEDMSIGGAYGVKVFPDAELSAEQAALFNIEFFAKLPEVSNLNHKVGLFYDAGTASMSDKTADVTFETRTLQDVGVGYYTNYKNAFTKLQVARVVGGQDIETENVGNISRVLVQAGMVF